MVTRVALDLASLPPPDKLINLLADEIYPFERWFDFARGYLAAGDEEAFILFSIESLTPGVICKCHMMIYDLMQRSHHA